ncbi:adenylate/guanylate cyclase domain-containing protein [Denitratisoma sp. agr-D3]
MNQHWIRYCLGCAIALVLLGHSVQLYRIPLISHLDAIAYDAKVRLTLPGGIDDKVVIVDIDEKSLAEVGRWPWGRDKLAKLMDRLFDQYKVAVVGFDVVFAEPDDSSGMGSLNRLASKDLKDNEAFQALLNSLRPRLDYDARFAAALAKRPVVLGYYFSNQDEVHTSGALPAPVVPAGAIPEGSTAISSWSGYGANLERFQQAAGAAGHFDALVDFDGTTRRVPLLAEYHGAYYESLALAMVRRLLDVPTVFPGYPDDADPRSFGSMEWLDLPSDRGLLRIPVDENGATLVPYRGYRGSFRYIPMADVLAGRTPASQLAGKIVLIGASSPGLMDLRVTPVGNVYPGVEVHANLVAGILNGNLKHKPAYVLGADLLSVLLAAVAMIFLLPQLSPLKASLAAAGIAAALIGVNLSFWNSGMVLPLANGLVLVALLYGLNMAWGYFVESRTKRQFTELFGQYVPPELVEEMARNPKGYSMDGRKAELTVLFSDVRGFTTISEGLAPDQLATLMNEYLGAMTAVIRDQKGTLDKYIGDAIMAFWGAPMEDPQHAKRAVATALAMQQALVDLNRHLVARGWPELKIGVGINTGVMTVGDMGSPVRKAYTVMGDAVNLGSRLEGITKQYGVGIIVGETTRQLLLDIAVFRELDRVRVKGKEEPVGIYEPLGFQGQVAAAELEELACWAQALNAYRAQQWDQAETLLRRLTGDNPRYLYQLYLERIAHLRQDPPGDGWDGVTTFETK